MKEVPKEFKHKVELPQWWTEQAEPIMGLTDKVDTCLCADVPCWYVYVPDCNYAGYFSVTDLTA